MACCPDPSLRIKILIFEVVGSWWLMSCSGVSDQRLSSAERHLTHGDHSFLEAIHVIDTGVERPACCSSTL